MSHQQRKQKRVNPTLVVVVAVVAVTAIRRQLALPKEERTWHGVVEVPVPYDFRFPTFDRVRRSFWDPDDDRLVLPRAFGIGWSVNVATVVKRLTGKQG